MSHRLRAARTCLALTITELMVAVGLASLLLAAVASMNAFGLRSFVALGNYSDLDTQSRLALDTLTREIRQASALLSFTNGSTVQSMTFTNSPLQYSFTIKFDSDAGTLVFSKTGQPDQTNLTGCDSWSFAIYQRTPFLTSSNMTFCPATNSSGVVDPSLCKLVNMTWKCSRSILGAKVNTETVQTAQIVLRDKD